MDLLAKSPATGKITLSCFLIYMSLIFTFAHAAGIYKWVDEQGNVHYSQDPQGQSAQELKIKTPKSSSSDDKSSAQAEPKNAKNPEKAADGDANNNAEKQAAAAQEQKEAKEKNCQISIKRLATITAGGRLYEVDEKGERSYWDDETRKAKQEEAQKSVDQWCTEE